MMVNTKNTKNNTLLFNNELKERYLKTISIGTRTSYERIFKLTKVYEELLEKDVNSFSKDEIETVLYSFKANNRNTIESYARIISSYLNWCVKNKIIKKNILEDYRPDDFDKFLTNDEQYLMEKNIRRYEDFCENFQDAVILRLLFIGVNGKNMSELRNLKRTDIDIENMEIRLINSLKEDSDGFPLKYTERKLKIDNRTLYLLEGAINQKEYLKKNGQMVETKNVKPYNDLVVNDYVIRASITRTDSFNKPTDKFVIYRRIDTISNTLGIDLTAKFVQRSGMIYYAYKLTDENSQELTLDDLKIIANNFNVKSYHNLKGYINNENIRKTYKS